MKRASFSVLFSSLYVLAYLILLQLGYSQFTWVMFLFSPLILLFLTYSVVRYGKYSAKELREGEEWGYEDVDKEKFGT